MTVNALKSHIAKLRTKIETLSGTTELTLEELDDERAEQIEKVKAFTIEYEYQALMKKKTLFA